MLQVRFVKETCPCVDATRESLLLHGGGTWKAAIMAPRWPHSCRPSRTRNHGAFLVGSSSLGCKFPSYLLVLQTFGRMESAREENAANVIELGESTSNRLTMAFCKIRRFSPVGRW